MGRELSSKWSRIIRNPLAKYWLWPILREQELFDASGVTFETLRLLYEVSDDCKLVMFIVLSKWGKRYGRHIHPGYGFLPHVWVNFFNGTEKPLFYFQLIECVAHHYDEYGFCIYCAHQGQEPKQLEEKQFYCVCGYLESHCQCQICKYCKRVTKALVRDFNEDGDSENEDGCDCILCEDCDACINDEPAHTKDCTTPECKCEDKCPDCGEEDCECSSC